MIKVRRSGSKRRVRFNSFVPKKVGLICTKFHAIVSNLKWHEDELDNFVQIAGPE